MVCAILIKNLCDSNQITWLTKLKWSYLSPTRRMHTRMKLGGFTFRFVRSVSFRFANFHFSFRRLFSLVHSGQKCFIWHSTSISLNGDTFCNGSNKLLDVKSTQLHVQTLTNIERWTRVLDKAIGNWFQFTTNWVRVGRGLGMRSRLSSSNLWSWRLGNEACGH